MDTQRSAARPFWRAAGLVGVVAAIGLASVPAAGTSGTSNRLFAFVRATNPGPLPACSGGGTPESTCTAANAVHHFVYVTNANLPTQPTAGAGRRTTLPYAFVVNSVDQRMFVDGVEFGGLFTFTPPPNAFPRNFSGVWPATVSCQLGTSDPCNLVSNPAVVPGEITAVVKPGWVHGDSEPNGTYVFKFTIHGTLNGTPVDLTASSRPIVMTD